MSICWYCHHGWPKPVADIYDAAVAKLDGCDHPLHFGPSHVVWEDENFDEESIRSCIAGCEDGRAYYSDGELACVYSDEELAVIRWSLEQLLALPEEVRCPEPEDYDGENPERYPPPAGVEMVKR